MQKVSKLLLIKLYSGQSEVRGNKYTTDSLHNEILEWPTRLVPHSMQ